jgi:hypothetical protein
MTEPTITCPNCKIEIKLTESLAAPLIEATRKEFEKRLSQKNADIAKQESALREREDALSRDRETIDAQVTEKMSMERAKIISEEARKARLAVATDLEQKTTELENLKEAVKQQDEKLAEAQKAQIDHIRKTRELDDAIRAMELTIEKRIQESLDTTRQQARREAEEQLKFKVMEKEQTISAMQKQIAELNPNS